MPGCEAANRKVYASLPFEVEVILNSGLLLEADYQCISCFLEPISLVEEKPVWREMSLLYGIGICVITRAWRKDLLPWLIPAVYTCVAAGHFVNTWYIHQQRKKLGVTLLALLHVLKEITCQTRRIILFIQENELLLKGFTLARSRTNVIDDLKSLRSSWYLMTGLRERIALVMQDIIVILKYATINLVREFPLKGQLDHEHNYAAFLIQEELGITTSEADNINKYTLVYLKKLQNANILLQSELLRHYALCCMPSLWYDEFQSLTPLLETTDNVSHTLSSFVESLTLAYKFYSCYGKDEGSINQQPQPLVCNVTNVFVGIHSARLYMQGMLQRTMQLEEMLEQSKQEDNMEADDINHIFAEMKDIANEMTSCMNCIEIVLNFCKSSEVNFEPPMEVTPISLSLNCENVLESEPIPVGYSDFDTKVEDEVFEALVEHRLDNDDYDDFYDIKIEKENEQQRECSMRMMSELKKVLILKAEAMKRREDHVLHNKGILITEDNSRCEADISQMETEDVSENDTLKSEVMHSLTSKVLDCLKSEIDSSGGAQRNIIKLQTSDESLSAVGLPFEVLGKSLVGEEETFGDLAESDTDEVDNINT